MHARIRVKTRGGPELNPGSVEVFARLVAEGDVSEDDLIYDALTGEWAPARVHPVYRMVVDGMTGDEQDAEAPPTGDLGLSLAPAAPEPTPEDASAAFIAKMEAERASDPARGPVQEDLRIVGGGSGVGAVVSVLPEPEPEPEEPVLAPVASAKRSSRRRRRTPAPRVLWMAGSLMAVTAAVTIPAGLRTSQPAELAASDRRARTVARGERLLGDAAKQAALQAVVVDAQSLLEELEVGPIPDTWLEGAYLADAASHPEVRAAWESYLAFVWALRANEERRYREAYLVALDEEGVEGPARSMRLSSALLAFRDGRADREKAYGRVEELAVASLSLHDLLVHLSGSIRYVPAVGAGIVSDDPAIEAVGVDEGTQQLLDDALDRVTAAIEAGGKGPESRQHVPEWVGEQVRSVLIG